MENDNIDTTSITITDCKMRRMTNAIMMAPTKSPNVFSIDRVRHGSYSGTATAYWLGPISNPGTLRDCGQVV